MVHAEYFPCATETSLHLVGDEQDAVIVANFSQTGQEVGRGHDAAGLALHRFDDDRSHAIAHAFGCLKLLLHRTGAAVGHEAHPLEERKDGLAEHGFAGDGQRSERLAVESFLHRDDAFFAGVKFGQLERALDRLGAAVGKETLLDVARGDVGDDAAELRAQRVEHFLRILRRAVELGFDRLDDFRVTQPVAVEPEAAEHVDELAAERVADE